MEYNTLLLDGTLLNNGHYRIERPLGFNQNCTNIIVTKISDTSVRCDFIKNAYQADGREWHAPAYLRFGLIGGDWKIVEESAPLTDKNLKKMKNK